MELPENLAIAPELTVQETHLSARELQAYRTWRQMGQPKLSPDNQAKFFSLFLKGETIEEIVRLNRGYSLGQIVEARVDGDWDARRERYLQDLLDNTRSLVQQTALESIRFVADQLAVAHKRHGEAARRYIQTGDETHLTGFTVESLKDYKSAVETFQKLTGQDNKQQVQHSGHVTVDSVAAEHRPLTPAEAANIIKLRVGKK